MQTFGFFMVLGFAGAWFAMRVEYRRKEALGIIHPFIEISMSGAAASPGLLCLSGILGFIAGAKIGYRLINRAYYIGSLQDLLFSFRGNLYSGLAAGVVAVGAVWWYKRRHQLAVPRRETLRVHPYQLMDRLLLYCGLFGFLGAIVSAKLENTTGFSQAPLQWLFVFNGLNFYGALIAGALTYLFINRRHGIPLAVAADIGSPAMMLAYGIGRIGCHLAGDGDWGIVNDRPVPGWLRWAPDWVWHYDFPHNSVHQGVFIPGCVDNYCTRLAAPVYPTSFYEAVVALLLFGILWGLRKKIRRPGGLFFLYAIMNGTERFFIEFIRVNPVYSLGSWQLSQAQIIALGWMALGLSGTILLLFFRKKGKKV